MLEQVLLVLIVMVVCALLFFIGSQVTISVQRETLVDLESPFAGDVDENIKYARRCMRDSLKRGEMPTASHLLYTQDGILNDDLPTERILGIAAGKAWAKHASKTVIYTDRGISSGMKYGIEDAEKNGRTVEYRTIGA